MSTPILTPLVRLLHSRKFLLAIAGAVLAALQNGLNIDPTVLANIEALIISVIAAITVEDAAEKRAGLTVEKQRQEQYSTAVNKAAKAVDSLPQG